MFGYYLVSRCLTDHSMQFCRCLASGRIVLRLEASKIEGREVGLEIEVWRTLLNLES